MPNVPPQRPLRDDTAESIYFAQQIKATAEGLLSDGADRGEIKLLARALHELRDAFRLLARYRDRRKVTIFGSARTQPGTPGYEHAVALGQAMAQAGFMVITGAGPGIMEAGHRGAGTDTSIGINIRLPFEQDANQIIAEDEKLINLNYFFTRKLLFIKESDGLVLFPGGFGTLDEGFEALTLLQTGKSKLMPIVMVDEPKGTYWEKWREYVEKSLLGGQMISREDLSLFRITHSIEEAVAEIAGFYRVFHSERYVRGQLALRLKTRPDEALMQRIRREFADILAGGRFRLGHAHPDEANEPELAALPRLFVPFNRHSAGRLRQLIDLINAQP